MLMKKLIVSDTIRHPRDIYTEFVTGVRQRNVDQYSQSTDAISNRNPSRPRRRQRRRVTFRDDGEGKHGGDDEGNPPTREDHPTKMPRPTRNPEAGNFSNNRHQQSNASTANFCGSPQPGPSVSENSRLSQQPGPSG